MPKPKQDTSAENAVSDENETVSNNIDTVLTSAETVSNNIDTVTASETVSNNIDTVTASETVSNNIDTVLTVAETDDIPEPKPKKGKEPKQPKAERKSKKTVKSEVDTTNQPSDFTADYGTRRWKNRRAYTVI